MALPTGSGSEVLKRKMMSLDNSSATLTVPALHIYTIISINIMRNNAAKSDTDIYLNDGSTNVQLTNGQGGSEVPGWGTFVYNDRIVLMSGDSISVIERDGGALDVWISYIDQDWT